MASALCKSEAGDNSGDREELAGPHAALEVSLLKSDSSISSLLCGMTPQRRLSNVSSVTSEGSTGKTPLPKFQIGILCCMRVVEPISFFICFPFLPRLIRELGVAHEDRQVGYYVGLIESLFALTQFTTVLFWGRMSDKVGRKPVLLFGLTGSALSILSFGFSKSFAGLILSRCLNGALNGNVGVVKSMVGELSDETNSARAFALLPVCAAVGSAVGPLIGGYLSHPAEQYPDLFGNSELFKRFPYALPCMVAATFTLCGAVLGAFFLKETLVRPKAFFEQPKEGERQPLLQDAATITSPADPGAVAEQQQSTPPKPSSMRDLLTRQFMLNLGSYMLVVMASTMYLAILPLFSFTPIADGGIGFAQNEIGMAFFIRGILAIVIQLVFFPPLCNRFGPAKTFRAVVILYIPLVVLFPAMNAFARAGNTAAVWVLMVTTIAAWATANTAFAANAILVTTLAPSRADLGTMNGLTQSCVSLTRSFAPFTATSIFALSIDKHVLGGYFVYVCFFVVAVALSLASIKLKEGDATWRHHKKVKKPKRPAPA